MKLFVNEVLKSVYKIAAGIFTSMLEYLLCVFTYFTSQLTMMLTYIGLGYQYGHASDKIEGTGTNREIEQFETL